MDRPASIESRVAFHRALADPVRLRLVDELAVSDRSPGELGVVLDISSNLLAHHLGVLERTGIVERIVSAGDRRRRYVRLVAGVPRAVTGRSQHPAQRPLFVCSHNSARSQLAAALWRAHTGRAASSAGTRPASRVHPGAVAAAARRGLDITATVPRRVEEAELDRAQVITVCDEAHEELDPEATWLHWSIPDPVPEGTRHAFDRSLALLEERIARFVERQ